MYFESDKSRLKTSSVTHCLYELSTELLNLNVLICNMDIMGPATESCSEDNIK